MANVIGPAPAFSGTTLGTNLPSDEVQLEQTLAAAIRDTLINIPHLTEYVKVEMRDRFPTDEDDDIAITTVVDQIVSTKQRTSIIQIGIPSVTEEERTSDLHTQLNFNYPITFDLEVVDQWDDVNDTLAYKNSRELFMAVYMVARRAFKNNRTFGYRNCVHTYLQQLDVRTVEDEESGGRLHAGDWSIEVIVTGVLV